MKRTVTLLLVFAMALSLAGFASAEAATGMAAWTPFEENVELQIPVYDRGVAGLPSVQDNYWTQWIQENFGDPYNITVKFVPITRTAVETDYGLLASRRAAHHPDGIRLSQGFPLGQRGLHGPHRPGRIPGHRRRPTMRRWKRKTSSDIP